MPVPVHPESAKERSSDIAVLKKPIEMTVMKPTKGKITLIGRRLYTVMLAYSQNEMDTKIFDPERRYEFNVPLRSLLSHGSFHGGEVSFMKTYLREMNTTGIEWESTDQGENKKWTTLTMISEASIELKEGQNWVSWEFPSSIMKNIVRPGIYGRLNLKIATSIDSYVGTALYDICCRYRDNPSGVTSKQQPEWWIDALSQSARDPEKRREWRKFKDEKLIPGIEDINETSDLEIELIEERVGRAVGWVQFAVRKKNIPLKFATKSIDAAVLSAIEKLAGKLAIPLARVESLIRKYGEGIVKQRLEELVRRVEDDSLPVVERKLGYLRYMLDSYVPEQSAIDMRPPEKSPAMASPAAAAAASIRNQANQQANAQQTQQVKKGLKTLTREFFNSLPEARRRTFISDVIEQLKKDGKYNSADMRHAQSTTLVPGRLGAEVVEKFGEHYYREQWPGRTGDALLPVVTDSNDILSVAFSDVDQPFS